MDVLFFLKRKKKYIDTRCIGIYTGYIESENTMKTFKLVHYDYWDSRSTRKVTVIQAKTRGDATLQAMKQFGTSIVIVTIKEVLS